MLDVTPRPSKAVTVGSIESPQAGLNTIVQLRPSCAGDCQKGSFAVKSANAQIVCSTSPGLAIAGTNIGMVIASTVIRSSLCWNVS